MNPLHGIGGGEWQAAGQHFIQRDAERIQIAAAINRTIHSSRLFGRHVGQCSGENLGRFGRLPIAWQPRCDTEAHQPHFPGCSVHESVGGLDVLVDQTVLVNPAECGRQPNGDTKELSQLNRRAAAEPVHVEGELFRLLVQARDISRETAGAFDPTSGPLIALWRQCRSEGRIPTEGENAQALSVTGMSHVQFDEGEKTIGFDRPGVELNLGAIGKGHAVDRAAAFLVQEGVDEWLFHGGYSSVLVRGDHAGHRGWPVGIRNPLLPHERLATILLKDQSLSTSGSNVQYFRHEGKRYGHILDPRTGWPSEELLSVTVIAPTAAVADALSTAFFVGGVENALCYCDNHPQIGAIFIRPPGRGRTLEVLLCGIPDEVLFFEQSVEAEVYRRA